MKRSLALVSPLAAVLYVGLLTPSLAAEPVVTGNAMHASSDTAGILASKPAEVCLNDLSAFHSQMQKDGYWVGGSSDAYGYPVGDVGYGFGYAMGPYRMATAKHFPSTRPGYEVRALVAAANILARHGQQQPCEDVLATTKSVYGVYVAELHDGGAPLVGEPHWRREEIAHAQPVTNNSNAFRSDQLLGTEVRTSQNGALGSIDDLVMSPDTGKIAYLVIARGGIFGIGEKYVPVPWQDFKVTPNAHLLVLDTTKNTMNAAPQVTHDQSMTTDQFNEESPKVDAYWKTHLSDKGSD